MRRIVLVVSLLLAAACEPVVPNYGGEVSVAYLWSIATGSSVNIKNDYTIRGYVVANDLYNEVSSSFVLADDTAGVVVEVDSRDVDALVPLFSVVELRCSGLTLGRVGRRLLLGKETDGEFVTSRIAEAELQSRITVDSMPKRRVEPLKRHIAELGAYDMYRYIRIDSLRAVDDANGYWTDLDTLNGERLTSLRHFSDGSDTLAVVVDGRCSYSQTPLPEGLVSLCGILDWHDGDMAFRITNRDILTLK